MTIQCPECSAKFRRSEPKHKTVVKAGRFYRKSDRKTVQRYFCRHCSKCFSSATFSLFFAQKKRHMNGRIFRNLVAGVSMRECARIHKVNQKTVARKLEVLAIWADSKLKEFNQVQPAAQIIEFDDLETFEHTKCKPVSVTLAVEHKSRRILGLEVASMPAKGLLAKKSLRKYGPRSDDRPQARERLFKKIKTFVNPDALIKSDMNPHYPHDVKRHFPEAEHIVFKGRDGCIVGQGELKRVGFDPLFSLNHTCAVFRYRTSRLIRKTWNTSKKIARIEMHMKLVALHHNRSL